MDKCGILHCSTSSDRPPCFSPCPLSVSSSGLTKQIDLVFAVMEFLSNLVVFGADVVYPAYKSFKAIKTDDKADDIQVVNVLGLFEK